MSARRKLSSAKLQHNSQEAKQGMKVKQNLLIEVEVVGVNDKGYPVANVDL